MKKTGICCLSIIVVFALVACSTGYSEQTQAVVVIESTEEIVTDESTTIPVTNTVDETLTENSEIEENDEDYAWNEEDEIPITFNDDSIAADSNGVSVSGSTVTITKAGTYNLNGKLTDGQVIVDTEDEDVIRLILNGVELNSSTSAPIFISKAKSVVIILAEQTENWVTDGNSYVFNSSEDDEPDAAIYSKADLTIIGEGSLNVEGNYKDGIASKDGLNILSGNITVTAVDDGIRGKDYISIKNSVIKITSQGDGLKSTNEEDESKGFINITNGTIDITSGGDAISAVTDVTISNGEFNLISGGGSNAMIDETVSAKGIKGAVNVALDGGKFTISSADDAIHSNGNITINGGTFTISSGDDGMHADSTLTINDGIIQIANSYEGLESAVIIINGGDLHINASDDGINVAGGADSAGMDQGMGGQPGGAHGGQPGGGRGQDTFASSGNYYLYINGGYIFIDAGGDGLDSNGSIDMTDGIVIVNGPTNNGNGPLDYMSTFTISSGTLLAVGSSGMAQAPGDTSTQNSILVNLNGTLEAGSLIHIQNEAGEDILTFAPTKQIQSIVYSSVDLIQGETYQIYFGGNSSGTATDGLFNGGVYSGGELYTSMTLDGIVTSLGGGRGRNRP